MNFRELRRSIQYSQNAFANLLGVSISSLRRWENGEANPSPLAKERLEYVANMIKEGKLDELEEENILSKVSIQNTQKSRSFIHNGKKYEVQYMPYVFNGPEDQLNFYNTLISLQESDKSQIPWDVYRKRLSILQYADSEATSQALLELPKPISKSWSADNGAHGWHRYVGRFPSQLVRALINHFQLDSSDILLDPFSGSGTTLVEAKLLGISSIGIEVSPLSAMISRVKSNFPNDTGVLEEHIKNLEEFYKSKWDDFTQGKSISNITHEDIISRTGNPIPIFANYEKWFSKEALLGTSIIIEYIMHIGTDNYVQEFIATALSAKMRSIGNVDVDVVRAEYRKNPRENVDVLKLVTYQLRKMLKSIHLMNSSHRTTISNKTYSKVIQGSCLNTTIEPGSISAIITSPPYGVESLSYLRTHLLSFRALEPLLGVDPYNIGTDIIGSEYLENKKIDIANLRVTNHSETFNSFFEKLLKESDSNLFSKRLMMMMQFFEDMDKLASNFHLWLRSGGKVAFVIGNKKIGDHLIPTDKIITEIFKSNGFAYIDEIAHKLKTNNSNSQVPWQEKIIENEYIIFYEKL